MNQTRNLKKLHLVDSSQKILTAIVFGGYLLLRAAMLYDAVAHRLPSFRRAAPPEKPVTLIWAIVADAALLAGCTYWAYPHLFR